MTRFFIGFAFALATLASAFGQEGARVRPVHPKHIDFEQVALERGAVVHPFAFNALPSAGTADVIVYNGNETVRAAYSQSGKAADTFTLVNYQPNVFFTQVAVVPGGHKMFATAGWSYVYELSDPAGSGIATTVNRYPGVARPDSLLALDANRLLVGIVDQPETTVYQFGAGQLTIVQNNVPSPTDLTNRFGPGSLSRDGRGNLLFADVINNAIRIYSGIPQSTTGNNPYGIFFGQAPVVALCGDGQSGDIWVLTGQYTIDAQSNSLPSTSTSTAFFPVIWHFQPLSGGGYNSPDQIFNARLDPGFNGNSIRARNGKIYVTNNAPDGGREILQFDAKTHAMSVFVPSALAEGVTSIDFLN